MAHRGETTALYRHYQNRQVAASASTPATRVVHTPQTPIVPQVQMQSPAYSNSVPMTYVGPQGQTFGQPRPDPTGLMVDQMMGAIVPYLNALHAAGEKRAVEFEASVKELSAQVAEVRKEASENAKKASEQIEKGQSLHLATVHALAARVKKLDKIVGKSQDLDQSKSIMGRLDELTYSIGELLERAKDPEANLSEGTSVRPAMPLCDTSKLQERGVSPMKLAYANAVIETVALESSPPRLLASAQGKFGALSFADSAFPDSTDGSFGTTPLPDLPVRDRSSLPASTPSNSVNIDPIPNIYTNAAVPSIRPAISPRDISKLPERSVNSVKLAYSNAAIETAARESSPPARFASAEVGTIPIPDLPICGRSSLPASTSFKSADIVPIAKTYTNAAVAQTPPHPFPKRKFASAEVSMSPVPKFPSRRDVATSPMKSRNQDVAIEAMRRESSLPSRIFTLAEVGTSPISKQVDREVSSMQNNDSDGVRTPDPAPSPQESSVEPGTASPLQQSSAGPSSSRHPSDSDATLVEDFSYPAAQSLKIVKALSPFDIDADALEYVDDPMEVYDSLPGPPDQSADSIVAPSCNVKDSPSAFSSVDWSTEQSDRDNLPRSPKKPMAIFHPNTSPEATKEFTLLSRQSFSPDGTVASLRRDALGNPFAGPMTSTPPRPVSPYYSRPSVSPMPSPPSTRSPSPVLKHTSAQKSASPTPDVIAQSPTISLNPTSESLDSGISKSSTIMSASTSTPAPMEETSTSQHLSEMPQKSVSPAKSNIVASCDERSAAEEAHVSQLIMQASSVASSPVRRFEVPASTGPDIVSNMPQSASQLSLPKASSDPPSRPTSPARSMTPASIKRSSSPPATFISQSPINAIAESSQSPSSPAPRLSAKVPSPMPSLSPAPLEDPPSPPMFQEGPSRQQSTQRPLSSSPLRDSAALFTPITSTPLSLSIKREIVEAPSPIYISSTSVTPEQVDLTRSPSPALSALTDFSDDDVEIIPVRKLKTSTLGKQKEKPKEKTGLLKLDLRELQKNAAVTRVKKRKPKVIDGDGEQPPLKRARQRKSESLPVKKDPISKDPIVKKEGSAYKTGASMSKKEKLVVKKEGTQSPSKKERKARKSAVTIKWPGRKRAGDAGFLRKFIKCDMCSLWYHYGCVGIVPDDKRILSTEMFTCPPCEVGSSTHRPPSSDSDAACARTDCSHQSALDEYFVSAIVGRKSEEHGRGHRYKWLVKWDGYPITQATWEGEDSMSDPQKLIEEFEDAAVKEGIDLDEDPHETAILLQEALNGGWR